MAIRRFVAQLPASYDLLQMRALTTGRYASAVDVNVVDNGDGTFSLAVYFDGFSPTSTSLDAWRADVAAAVVQHPTLDEQTATQATNGDNLRTKAQTALTNNQTYLGLASPTNAQNVAQVQALTRQVNALIRLVIGQLDTTAGT